jgi:isoleucyl-tRNA synthetase
MEKENDIEKNSGYSSVDSEKEVLNFWESAKIFEKSLAKNSPKGRYIFYDGPPFATGTPHYGHILASTIKDVIPRYKTMKGYIVERKWGWDCHGLPIENIAEKELGIRKKKDIEEMGVAKFNEFCRSKVLSYAESWKFIIKRIGRWVDMENSYSTMDLKFMESVWWVFKNLWDKDLIYEGYRSMYICPRCETTLSQTEVSEGYKMVKDLSVIVRFKLRPDQKIGSFKIDNNTYVLAWTTTPWTLIGNVALAVNKDIKYAIVDLSDQPEPFNGRFIVALDKVQTVLEGVGKKSDVSYKNYVILEGVDLIGTKYEPIFNYYDNSELKNRENAWAIYNGDFVTTESGTGVVHVAPAFGEDDMNLGKENDLPFIQHVNIDGTIKDEVKDFAGMNVKPIDDNQKTDVEIIKYLSRHNFLFKKEKFEHSYPHCWRCETPLINYATSSWFVNIRKIKPEALLLAKNINWFPSYIKEGRFGNWLADAHDWSISRQRFWASVIPIWKCACGEIKVFGSISELENISGQRISDIHKHNVDKIKFPCDKCGGEMSRIPDVLDTWFDSASMPYAQIHYPFENKAKFESSFPAEFIGEGLDQTRCWFYYLHIIGTAISSSNSFKNVIVNGIVLAEDGKKMSKKLKNYPDPSLIIDRYGADALRFYLISSPVVSAENLNFSEEGLKIVSRKNILILWNVFKFYEMFKEDDSATLQSPSFLDVFNKSNNILDKWIMIRLNQLISSVDKDMDDYNLQSATRPITDFINDLSTWYIRRSRDRFKSENKTDRECVIATTFFILNQISKVIAPFMPFISEQIWQEINDLEFKSYDRSVHLEDWPKFVVLDQDKMDILERMELSKEIVEIGLSLRSNHGIKVRQVLKKIKIKLPESLLKKVTGEYSDLIKDEVNVKEVELIECAGAIDVELDINITHDLEVEGLVRELIRTVNSLRKKAGLTIKDRAKIYYSDNLELNDIFNQFGEDILRKTLCSGYEISKVIKADFGKELMVYDKKTMIGIEID